MHPAYQAALPDAAAIVESVARPLRGIPGVPVRAKQGPGGDVLPSCMLTFSMRQAPAYDKLPVQIAGALVRDPDGVAGCRGNSDTCYSDAQRVQDVIGAWLVQQAGFTDQGGSILEPDQRAALERFSALEPSTQRRWLEANYAALRAGRLTLEELP